MVKGQGKVSLCFAFCCSLKVNGDPNKGSYVGEIKYAGVSVNN